MTRSALDTPMMRQYLAIKARHPDAIVFYRMGDFYEMFLADAELAAPLLDIALTTRDRGKDDAVPMCGVPVHSADAYVKRLADLGHRVAICEQVEDARQAAGRRLVKRDVVEVVTPGLVGDPDGSLAGRELCIAAVFPDGGGSCGLAILDASTGDLRATQVARDDGATVPSILLEELARVAPREVLVPASSAEGLRAPIEAWLPGVPRTPVEPDAFDSAGSPAHPEGLAPEDTDPGARAAAALLAYLAANQPFALGQVSSLRRYTLSDAMVLDASTRAHLELFRNAEDGGRRNTLVERIDDTMTPLGARRLARWLAYPLVDPPAIRSRQDAVAHLAERDRPRTRLRESLRAVRDLERLLARVARPTASPRDLVALRRSLEALPGVVEALGDPDDGRLATTAGEVDAGRPAALRPPAPVPEVARLLAEALVDDPPALPRGSRGANETGYIRDGFRAELDALRDGVRKSKEWIAGLEARERERTGVSNLKVRFHPVHGYSLEITKSNVDRAPSDYERKQTLANAERFTTPELREVERNVLGANERAAALEREVLESVRLEILAAGRAIRAAADAVADVDATQSLAEVARRGGWVRPVVDDGDVLDIRAGVHPVIQPLLAAGGAEEFVPNDTRLRAAAAESPGEDDAQLLLITGPNMSGKSTYLRQVAQIALLAQIGSFVPAESARIGVVDRVFTRVGASDRLAKGESTFMVEMKETADILLNATRRSLVILDEIGRGTSTFDGLSIAWAVAEHLHDDPGLGCRTLFATHYHELTDLSQTRPGLRNAHFEVREWGEDVVFLRRLVAGGANRSYGIQVARLAGLPSSLVARSREILANLEAGEFDERGRPRLAADGDAAAGADQLGLFARADDPRSAAENGALESLRRVDPDRTTPMDALSILQDLVARLRGGAGT